MTTKTQLAQNLAIVQQYHLLAKSKAGTTRKDQPDIEQVKQDDSLPESKHLSENDQHDTIQLQNKITHKLNADNQQEFSLIFSIVGKEHLQPGGVHQANN